MLKSKIPKDILNKIDSIFIEVTDKKKVFKIIETIFMKNWGVGQDQLARCILTLSDGKLEIIEKMLEDLEPRDLILKAEEKVGNPKHYFIPTFDEIEKITIIDKFKI